MYDFNKYILKCWRHLKRDEHFDAKTILEQNIWKNKFFSFTVKRKQLMLQGPNLTKKGYTRVGDFIDHDGRIIQAEEAIAAGLPWTIFIEWKSAIKQIKAAFHRKNINITAGYTERNNISEKDASEQTLELRGANYHESLDKLTQRNTLKIVANRRKSLRSPHSIKACNEHSQKVDEWNNRYINIIKQSNSTKTRSFLFKNYSGLLYGNHDLYKFGFRNTKDCENCKSEDQTVNHLLLECPKARELRDRVYTQTQIIPTKFEERYGTGNHPVDYILLQLNRFIYQCKYLEITPNMEKFRAMINLEHKTEKAIAEKNYKLRTHFKKWDNISSIFRWE